MSYYNPFFILLLIIWIFTLVGCYDQSQRIEEAKQTALNKTVCVDGVTYFAVYVRSPLLKENDHSLILTPKFKKDGSIQTCEEK